MPGELATLTSQTIERKGYIKKKSMRNFLKTRELLGEEFLRAVKFAKIYK